MADVYLLDTNIVSYYENSRSSGHGMAKEFLDSLEHDDVIAISVITLAEIECGLLTAPKMDVAQLTDVRSAMARFTLVRDITRHTVEHYAKLRAELFINNSPRYIRGRLTAKYIEDLREPSTERQLHIKETDLWIAAQSLEWNCILVTNDAMRPITSLKVDPPIRFLALK